MEKEIESKIDGAEMVLVPEGDFIMGIDEETLKKIFEYNHSEEPVFKTELPKRKVHVKSYYIDKFPVTNRQYRKFIEETGHRKPAFWDDPMWTRPNNPVVGIGWDDAKEYARWADKRLPKEAEWEKAARGTDERWWPWGNEFHKEYCNSYQSWGASPFSLGIRNRCTDIDKYPEGVSPYGAYDMAGNVWEMCDGIWLEGLEHRVMRGGCFISSAAFVRTTVRWSPADEANGAKWLGFRCVKDIK